MPLPYLLFCLFGLESYLFRRGMSNNVHTYCKHILLEETGSEAETVVALAFL